MTGTATSIQQRAVELLVAAATRVARAARRAQALGERAIRQILPGGSHPTSQSNEIGSRRKLVAITTAQKTPAKKTPAKNAPAKKTPVKKVAAAKAPAAPSKTPAVKKAAKKANGKPSPKNAGTTPPGTDKGEPTQG